MIHILSSPPKMCSLPPTGISLRPQDPRDVLLLPPQFQPFSPFCTPLAGLLSLTSLHHYLTLQTHSPEGPLWEQCSAAQECVDREATLTSDI